MDPERRATLQRRGLWRLALKEGVDRVWSAYGTVYRAYSTGGKTLADVRSWERLVRNVLDGKFQGVERTPSASAPSKVGKPPTEDEVVDEVDEAPPLWKATLATLAAQPAVWTWAAAARCRSAEGEAVHLEADPYTVAQIERHAAVIEAALGEGRRLVVETRRAAA